MDHARAKFARKGSDLQVVNEVGTDLTFGKDETTVHLMLRGSDEVTTVGPTSKDAVADRAVGHHLAAAGLSTRLSPQRGRVPRGSPTRAPRAPRAPHTTPHTTRNTTPHPS